VKAHIWKSPRQNDGCLNFVDENDEVLISGFGRRGKAKGDIPGVRFKVVKVSGVGLLALWKEKKVRMLWPVRSNSAAQTPAWPTGEAPLINSEFVFADSFPVYAMLVLQPHAPPNENLSPHTSEYNFFQSRHDKG
jgi:hypothetical protein